MSNTSFPVVDLMRSDKFVCEMKLGGEIERPQSAIFPRSGTYKYRRLGHTFKPSKITATLNTRVRGTVLRLRMIFADPAKTSTIAPTLPN